MRETDRDMRGTRVSIKIGENHISDLSAEDMDELDGGIGNAGRNKDHTVEIAASPFEDNFVGGDLTTKEG